MREARAVQEREWIERLSQQVRQIVEQVAAKDDILRLEQRLADFARQDMLERLTGKVDTLLVNAATKLEVGRLESKLEQVPTKEEFRQMEARLMDALPRLVTKQEWSVLGVRLERTPTKDEMAQALAPLKEQAETVNQELSRLGRSLLSLRVFLFLSLLLQLVTLCGLVLLWLQQR